MLPNLLKTVDKFLAEHDPLGPVTNTSADNDHVQFSHAPTFSNYMLSALYFQVTGNILAYTMTVLQPALLGVAFKPKSYQKSLIHMEIYNFLWVEFSLANFNES